MSLIYKLTSNKAKIVKAFKDPLFGLGLILNQIAPLIKNDETFLKWKYYAVFHRFPDLKKPQTYNEKLQWLKLYDKHPEYTQMVDKAEAKKYVDQVRQRYFKTGDRNNALSVPGPGFTNFDMDWMLSEWGKEYLGEGNRRRTDLRRFDKFTQGQWWFWGRATEDGVNLPAKRDRKYEWYPLPQSALSVNPGLIQNPNY